MIPSNGVILGARRTWARVRSRSEAPWRRPLDQPAEDAGDGLPVADAGILVGEPVGQPHQPRYLRDRSNNLGGEKEQEDLCHAPPVVIHEHVLEDQGQGAVQSVTVGHDAAFVGVGVDFTGKTIVNLGLTRASR